MVSAGTDVKVISGPFAGCNGKILAHEESAETKIGPLPPPSHDRYLVLVNLAGDHFEAYLDRNELEVVSTQIMRRPKRTNFR